MAFDIIKAEISLLLNQMDNQPEDRQELYLKLQEKLNELKAFGLPLPQDLTTLMQQLESEFAAQGGSRS